MKASAKLQEVTLIDFNICHRIAPHCECYTLWPWPSLLTSQFCGCVCLPYIKIIYLCPSTLHRLLIKRIPTINASLRLYCNTVKRFSISSLSLLWFHTKDIIIVSHVSSVFHQIFEAQLWHNLLNLGRLLMPPLWFIHTIYDFIAAVSEL